jgi:hypothetical protein
LFGPGVVIVLASGRDRVAATFARCHHGTGVRLMTPSDLGRAGWLLRLGRHGGSVVASGRRIPDDAVRAVVTRLPFVVPADIAHLIAPEDRQYAAAEMTAFLAAWLQSLDDRALNAPSPTFLAGLPQAPATSPTAAVDRHCQTHSISCVDGRPIAAAGAARSLAGEIAPTMPDRLVRLHFAKDGHGLSLSAHDPFVDLDSPAVARAVLRACG